MRLPIDYEFLGAALAYYRRDGFKYVEVPWAISREAIDATHVKPTWEMTVEGEQFNLTERFLVGSAEQALVSMNLPEGLYCACSPCFRWEREDLLHQHYFMKVELFETGNVGSIELLISAAEQFFISRGYDNLERVQTDEGTDLYLNGIEVGSYGQRSFGSQTWNYGTGLALPRMSLAASMSKYLITAD